MKIFLGLTLFGLILNSNITEGASHSSDSAQSEFVPKRTVVASVVATSDDPAGLSRDLDSHCRASSLAGFKRPKAYHIVETLPRNAANKVLRRLLRDAASDAQANGEANFHSVS